MHNHTSQTQFESWQKRLYGVVSAWNVSPSGQQAPVDPRTVPVKFKGGGTDHANDQKCLVNLFQSWKQITGHELRGEQILQAKSSEDLVRIMGEALYSAGKAMGTWDSLSMVEQDNLVQSAWLQLCVGEGKEAYDLLSLEEKRQVDLFLWAGCCMHKELNSAKGGNTQMTAVWKAKGIPGPILLLNKDNAAAAAYGPSAAQKHAQDVSQAGGVKTAQLAGAVFNHSDTKKGQQDTFRYYVEVCLFYPA